MINSVKLLQYPKHNFNYLNPDSNRPQVQNLIKKLQEGVEFKPGINIVVGENGCGKSTLLNIIREVNLCRQSFIPKLKNMPVLSLENLKDVFDHFEVKADFRIPVFNLYRLSEDYTSLSDSTGSSVLGTKESVTQFLALNEESNGQNVKGDLAMLFHYMWERQSECYPAIKYIKDLDNEESYRNKGTLSETTSTEVLEMFRKSTIVSDPITYTILMDEPDQGLDINNLKDIYGVLSCDKESTQLIAVVHNPILVYKLSKLPYVNIIEMSPNYLEIVKDFVNN